jgi:Tfp pilus assembly protein PilV
MMRLVKHPRCRNGGFTATELLVSASLLVVGLGTLSPLAIRCNRLWQDTRSQQLASEEMANQLERLTVLSAADRQQAMQEISLPTHLQELLPTAVLSVESITDQDGERVVLSLQMNPRSRPLVLVGWIDAAEEAVQ